MKTKQKAELEQLFKWALNKIFENHPEIEICWNDVRRCMANVWKDVTGIEV